MKKILSILLMSIVCVAYAKPALKNAPSNQGENKIGKIETICKQEGKYLGWPTVLCRKSGELIAVFSGDRVAHICPYGKVQAIRSFDNGKTWSAPETFITSPLDDRDAGIIELENGHLVLFWFNSIAYQNERILKNYPEYKKSMLEESTKAQRDKFIGSYSAVSATDGKKWGFPVRTYGVAPHGGIQLKNGNLLFVGKGGRGNDKLSRSEPIKVNLSTDGAKSWKIIAGINIPEGDKITDYWEPHVVEAENGDLIVQLRCHKDSFIRQSVSKDGGKTWTVAEKINVVGFPSHLKRLKDNRILMTYARRQVNPKKAKYEPEHLIMGQYARFSSDNGKTWGNEIMLCHSFTGDMGYPSSAELPDGDIYTIFYHNVDTTPDNHKQKVTAIFGVRWTPEKKK
ncbi:MAG: exo-alpha-sialidase [Verrucomicrobiaceae bacterium]|nr:exo-alpha-sialidase [Verrucomicrobiaceae bacterium]